MKVSLIQMNSGGDKAANLQSAKSLIEQAVAADRPDMVVLPEYFTHLASDVAARQASAEVLPDGETYRMLSGLAKDHGIYVHGGSLVERDGEDVYNTTVAFGRDGGELARYRKIHRFDVITPDGVEHKESASVGGGTEIVTYDIEGGVTVGCSICYDLRFPELYQALFKAGARIIMVPAAFMLLTGKDHWEVLLRARAIETTSYVVATGQFGTFETGACYGNSLVADPWGHVIARAKEQVGYVTAELDFDFQDGVRAKIPLADHKLL
ncbi:MAG: carbon-nitrogen hydrolase family protein [Rhodospirillales bacterium]|nr:carbon-nitrogen hydrolase family protein [Rhodospirillales bacterium]